MLIYGGIQLYRKFHETSSSDEEKVFLSPFKPSLRKESLPLKNVLRSFTLSFGATNEQKIRKIYYKYVQQKILQGISITTLDSPKQIKDKISIPTQDLQSLTEIYEKARYSHHTCTKEDLVEVKKKTSK